MLGPFRGHWLDKLRREWQMHRAFQTTMTLFQPDVVFILGKFETPQVRTLGVVILNSPLFLYSISSEKMQWFSGDLFDEGEQVNDQQFQAYAARFQRLFHVPQGTQIFGALGNHDVGFHYK